MLTDEDKLAVQVIVEAEIKTALREFMEQARMLHDRLNMQSRNTILTAAKAQAAARLAKMAMDGEVSLAPGQFDAMIREERDKIVRAVQESTLAEATAEAGGQVAGQVAGQA